VIVSIRGFSAAHRSVTVLFFILFNGDNEGNYLKAGIAVGRHDMFSLDGIDFNLYLRFNNLTALS
jgi:hypothetical protein